MKHVQPGSRVRVTGICFMNSSNPFDTRVPFNILLRSPDDITVIAAAPLADGRQPDPAGRTPVVHIALGQRLELGAAQKSAATDRSHHRAK